MRHLDLFSGIGGFALAARWMGWETVGFCEIEPYAQKVLRKHWPEVPIYDDVKELRGDDCGPVDIITGGFPCQDISYAGKGAGINGERSGLWTELARLIGEIRPRYAVLENVAALLSRGLDRVTGDLAQIGYDAEWEVIPAAGVGAGHIRERVWISAYPCGNRLQGRLLGAETFGRQETLVDKHVWNDIPTPRGLGSRNGVSDYVDRIRGLGNAIVPQVAYLIFRAIDESG